MQRAAILIGVKQTGDLHTLNAVSSGVRAMELWTQSQQLQPSRVNLITDDDEPVTIQRIKNAVKAIVATGTCEQLIIYFAGHGVNIRYGEYWLLSGAPTDTQEAVNVEGSVVLARQCGIPHVVLISDACRVAAEGIQAQYVTGSEIFPNEGAAGQEMPVDLFFACTLGRPALELRDPRLTGSAYRAIYTDTLVSALDGNSVSAISDRVTNNAVGYIRPRPLKKYLSAEVARILAAAELPAGINQTPDARITSDDSAWLARFPPGVIRAGPRVDAATESLPQAPALPASSSSILLPPSISVSRSPMPVPPRPVASASSIESGPDSQSMQHAARQLLRDALADDSVPHIASSERGEDLPPPPTATESLKSRDGTKAGRISSFTRAETLLRAAQRAATFSGAARPLMQSGFIVQGSEVISAQPSTGTGAVLQADGRWVDCRMTQTAASVVLRFSNGTGAILPALRHFIAELIFESNELISVTYEPIEGSACYQELSGRLSQLRQLRAVIAASARSGVFRLEGHDAFELARRMQLSKGIDPTMALYAAYAYHDLQQRDELQKMQRAMQAKLNLTFCDVALLSRTLNGRLIAGGDYILPFAPMLSQGWALLAAHNVTLPNTLRDLKRHLVPSLWTLFDEAGTEKILASMQTGEIR
jgi:hypothetical protein